MQVAHIADGVNFLTCTSWFSQILDWVGVPGISDLAVAPSGKTESKQYIWFSTRAVRKSCQLMSYANKSQGKPLLWFFHSGLTHSRCHLQFSLHIHKELVPGTLSDTVVHRCFSPLNKVRWYLRITHAWSSSLCEEVRTESKASHILNLTTELRSQPSPAYIKSSLGSSIPHRIP